MEQINHDKNLATISLLATAALSFHLILGNLGANHWWIPLSSPDTPSVTLTNLTNYQQSLYPTSKEIAEKYGINPAITLAIASHETADGQAVIGENNHWGIKGSEVTTATTEFYGGQMVYQELGFADKDSDRLFAETVVNILEEKGESPELTYTDPIRALEVIGDIYATDPNWAIGVGQHLKQIKDAN